MDRGRTESISRTSSEITNAAVRDVLAARISCLINVPFIDAVIGPDGGHNILHNWNDTDILPEDTTSEEYKESAKKRKGSHFDKGSNPFPERPTQWVCDILRIIQENAAEDGLFRKSGSLIRLQMLKNKIDNQEYCDFQHMMNTGDCTIHDYVGLLKDYLRSFADPAIPHYQYDAYMQATALPTHDQRMEATQCLTQLCPPGNRAFLKRLALCLATVAKAHQQLNLDGLAVCIAPSIVRPPSSHVSAEQDHETLQDELDMERSVVKFMISYSEEIFRVPTNIKQEVQKTEQMLRDQDQEKQIKVSHFVDTEGRVHEGIEQTDYKQVVDDHTQKELAKLAQFVMQQAQSDDPKKSKQGMKTWKKMYKDGVPGTPAPPPKTPRVNKAAIMRTPLRVWNAISTNLRTPKSAMKRGLSAPAFQINEEDEAMDSPPLRRFNPNLNYNTTHTSSTSKKMSKFSTRPLPRSASGVHSSSHAKENIRANLFGSSSFWKTTAPWKAPITIKRGATKETLL